MELHKAQFTYASKVQLKNNKGCFDAPRIDISCIFEGKTTLASNARHISLNFEPNLVVHLA
jgi:hypothetical protein